MEVVQTLIVTYDGITLSLDAIYNLIPILSAIYRFCSLGPSTNFPYGRAGAKKDKFNLGKRQKRRNLKGLLEEAGEIDSYLSLRDSMPREFDDSEIPLPDGPFDVVEPHSDGSLGNSFPFAHRRHDNIKSPLSTRPQGIPSAQLYFQHDLLLLSMYCHFVLRDAADAANQSERRPNRVPETTVVSCSESIPFDYGAESDTPQCVRT